MPAPTSPVSTPVIPTDPDLMPIDVQNLVTEVTTDLVTTANDMLAAQDKARTSKAALDTLGAAQDDAYNKLLVAQEKNRSELYDKNADAYAVSQAAWMADDVDRKAKEALFTAEIKYIGDLASRVVDAADPTPSSTTTSTTTTVGAPIDVTTTSSTTETSTTTEPGTDTSSTTETSTTTGDGGITV